MTLYEKYLHEVLKRPILDKGFTGYTLNCDSADCTKCILRNKETSSCEIVDTKTEEEALMEKVIKDHPEVLL